MKRPWNRENVRVLPAKINLSQQPWCRDALLLHVRGTGALRWESWALLTAAGGSSGMCWTAWSQTPPPAWSISTMMITTTTTNVCLRCSSTPPSGGPGWTWGGWSITKSASGKTALSPTGSPSMWRRGCPSCWTATTRRPPPPCWAGPCPA